jgi:IclR family pca regulon transcriptional regulator
MSEKPAGRSRTPARSPRDASQKRAPSDERLPIASLVKSLLVLEALGKAAGTSTLGALIEETGLERPTVQRIARTLLASGYVERTGHGEYAVAPRAYVLGAMLSKANHLALAARSALERLQRAAGEAVHMAVLDGIDVVCVENVPAESLLVFNFPVGARLPAYASSLGRSILAFGPRERAMEVLESSDRRRRTPNTITSMRGLTAELERVREQGYALVINEVEIGVCAAAAPVLGPHNEALAAINIVLPSPRFDEADVRIRLVPPLKETAAALSRSLAGDTQAPPATSASRRGSGGQKTARP